LTRAAAGRRVVYVEEPVHDSANPRIEIRQDLPNMTIAVPHLPRGSGASSLRQLVDRLLADLQVDSFIAWYYTPMALAFTSHLRPAMTIYDCMDELSAFAGAPQELPELERALLARADLVLTGGRSLYLAKRRLHPHVLELASGVDVAHFARARNPQPDPPDQADIPRPRIGFFGVIDERLDRDLLRAIAAQRPDWHFVLIGPVVKIDAGDLPSAANLHYVGQKSYDELPTYLAGWDVAMLPFARNDATRYISPTKTPEYLAAAKPVVSTRIADVVSPYGVEGFARIADSPAGFVNAIEASLTGQPAGWLQRVDRLLSRRSWDDAWKLVAAEIDSVETLPLSPSAAVPAARPSVA
jgi:UDP-galactopyranose mutase